jgi:hypothetical protein
MSAPDPLDSLLHTWETKPSVRADFERQVHARIADRTASGSARWRLRFAAALPLAASLAILIGSVAGVRMGQQVDDQAMADAYARSIDPVRMMISAEP